MRKKLLIIFTLLIVLGLLGAQVFVSQKLSTFGRELKSMEGEIDSLKLNNELLEREVATSSSLMTVAKKAAELGFTNPVFIYLEKPPVAFKK